MKRYELVTEAYDKECCFNVRLDPPELRESSNGSLYKSSEVDTALKELLEASREAMRCPHASIDCSVCKRHFERLQKALEPFETDGEGKV